MTLGFRAIIWLYIALNRTPNIDCYWGGQYPRFSILPKSLGFSKFRAQRHPSGDAVLDAADMAPYSGFLRVSRVDRISSDVLSTRSPSESLVSKTLHLGVFLSHHCSPPTQKLHSSSHKWWSPDKDDSIL